MQEQKELNIPLSDISGKSVLVHRSISQNEIESYALTSESNFRKQSNHSESRLTVETLKTIDEHVAQVNKSMIGFIEIIERISEPSFLMRIFFSCCNSNTSSKVQEIKKLAGRNFLFYKKTCENLTDLIKKECTEKEQYSSVISTLERIGSRYKVLLQRISEISPLEMGKFTATVNKDISTNLQDYSFHLENLDHMITIQENFFLKKEESTPFYSEIQSDQPSKMKEVESANNRIEENKSAQNNDSFEKKFARKPFERKRSISFDANTTFVQRIAKYNINEESHCRY